MKQTFQGWGAVAQQLREYADQRSIAIELNEGQAASLRALAVRLPNHGVIIADEVGMGKTRIAAMLTQAVIASGGRVAIVVPPGLGYQWQGELRGVGRECGSVLRSLWQYLEAWSPRPTAPPWFEQEVVLISHAFSNWRLGGSAQSWRWALLPEIYARWRKTVHGRWPRSYLDHDLLSHECDKRECVKRAAESIVSAIQTTPVDHAARIALDQLVAMTPWPGALDGAEYDRNAELRPWLERAVGLGLGAFDLVIVDEAHKSRGSDSGLNRILNAVLWRSAQVRCLALTATPVELHLGQWDQMLERVGVDVSARDEAAAKIKDYADAVAEVRRSPSDDRCREQLKKSSMAFKTALDPYLLRRDKREDPDVQRFVERSCRPSHEYRSLQEIAIETTHLAPAWKQAICAAEALSFVAKQADDPIAKRLRLTMGSGHGIAGLLISRDTDGAEPTLGTDDVDHEAVATEASLASEPQTDAVTQKRMARVQWWRNVLTLPFAQNPEATLFEHPGILAAVATLEAVCERGEKVLVFGRLTRPMQALVQLLNAREMLRSLDRGSPWPQSKIHDEDEWLAVQYAHRQLGRRGELCRSSLDGQLHHQYQELEIQRREFRERLIDLIQDGLNALKSGDSNALDQRLMALFEAFKQASASTSQGIQNVATVARAVMELVGSASRADRSTEVAQAFIDVVTAASDRDEGDSDGDGQLDASEAAVLWGAIVARLHDEYSRPQGGFARLMNGATHPSTRRFLQLAFNRRHGYPKVLVAQSLVGREGLNLHKACRTVVLLHPEWNPGVVEQQIGRVDRIGGLWQELLDQWVQGLPNHLGNPPQIEIKPVVFQGTYDEKNWEVLRERWDDLRAQLHGVVIPPSMVDRYPESRGLFNEINQLAPNFSPTLSHALT